MERIMGANKKFLFFLLLSVCIIFLPAATCCGIGASVGGDATATPGLPAATATPNLVIYHDALDGSSKAD